MTPLHEQRGLLSNDLCCDCLRQAMRDKGATAPEGMAFTRSR